MQLTQYQRECNEFPIFNAWFFLHLTRIKDVELQFVRRKSVTVKGTDCSVGNTSPVITCISRFLVAIVDRHAVPIWRRTELTYFLVLSTTSLTTMTTRIIIIRQQRWRGGGKEKSQKQWLRTSSIDILVCTCVCVSFVRQVQPRSTTMTWETKGG